VKTSVLLEYSKTTIFLSKGHAMNPADEKQAVAVSSNVVACSCLHPTIHDLQDDSVGFRRALPKNKIVFSNRKDRQIGPIIGYLMMVST
jgi:hypothetical protein